MIDRGVMYNITYPNLDPNPNWRNGRGDMYNITIRRVKISTLYPIGTNWWGSGTNILNVDSWFLILDSWFLILNSWFLILDSWFLILDSWIIGEPIWLTNIPSSKSEGEPGALGKIKDIYFEVITNTNAGYNPNPKHNPITNPMFRISRFVVRIVHCFPV